MNQDQSGKKNFLIVLEVFRKNILFLQKSTAELELKINNVISFIR